MRMSELVFNLGTNFSEGFQEGVNYQSKWTWEIRIRTLDQEDALWETIKPEPKTPICRVSVIKDKCKKLLEEYSLIESIFIIAKENSKLFFQLSRD